MASLLLQISLSSRWTLHFEGRMQGRNWQGCENRLDSRLLFPLGLYWLSKKASWSWDLLQNVHPRLRLPNMSYSWQLKIEGNIFKGMTRCFLSILGKESILLLTVLQFMSICLSCLPLNLSFWVWYIYCRLSAVRNSGKLWGIFINHQKEILIFEIKRTPTSVRIERFAGCSRREPPEPLKWKAVLPLRSPYSAKPIFVHLLVLLSCHSLSFYIFSIYIYCLSIFIRYNAEVSSRQGNDGFQLAQAHRPACLLNWQVIRIAIFSS